MTVTVLLIVSVCYIIIISFNVITVSAVHSAGDSQTARKCQQVGSADDCIAEEVNSKFRRSREASIDDVIHHHFIYILYHRNIIRADNGFQEAHHSSSHATIQRIHVLTFFPVCLHFSYLNY